LAAGQTKKKRKAATTAVNKVNHKKMLNNERLDLTTTDGNLNDKVNNNS